MEVDVLYLQPGNLCLLVMLMQLFVWLLLLYSAAAEETIY